MSNSFLSAPAASLLQWYDFEVFYRAIMFHVFNCLCPSKVTKSVSLPVMFSVCEKAPWGLALLEAVVMTLLYWILFSSDKPWRHIKEFHYSFSCSLEDIVLLSYLRFLAVLLAYLLGTGQRMMR